MDASEEDANYQPTYVDVSDKVIGGLRIAKITDSDGMTRRKNRKALYLSCRRRTVQLAYLLLFGESIAPFTDYSAMPPNSSGPRPA
jgi:hypothetical protein